MPTATIEVSEVPGRWHEIISWTASGMEVIVTEQNVPRARLVPLHGQSERVPGLHPGAITTTEDFDDPLPESFWTQTP